LGVASSTTHLQERRETNLGFKGHQGKGILRSEEPREPVHEIKLLSKRRTEKAERSKGGRRLSNGKTGEIPAVV